MFPECKKCRGAGIAGVAAVALVLHCPIELEKHKCPYLSDHQHTHQEVYIPSEYSQMEVVVATSGELFSHPNLLDSEIDSEREGNRIYYIDVTSSGV